MNSLWDRLETAASIVAAVLALAALVLSLWCLAAVLS